MITDERQREVAGEFLERHPEFPKQSAAPQLLTDRVHRLLGEGKPYCVELVELAYEQLKESGVFENSEHIALKNFERMSTPDMEKYLRSQGML